MNIFIEKSCRKCAAKASPRHRHRRRLTKSWLMILIIIKVSFLWEKKILARLKQKTTLVLMCFVMKIG